MQLGQPTAIHHIARRQDQAAVLAELDTTVTEAAEGLEPVTTAPAAAALDTPAAAGVALDG